MNIIKKVLQTLGFLWIFAVVITQAHAQATSPAAPLAVESANIMDIPKGSDAAAQREREQTQHRRFVSVLLDWAMRRV